MLKLRLFEVCSKWRNVLFTNGNHELYLSNRGQLNQICKDVKRKFPNFHRLDNSTVEIDGQRFIGATMWFRNRPDNFNYQNLLNDFNMIIGFKKWVYSENAKTLQYFADNMRSGDIVVTHHAPCELSVPDRYRGEQLNRFYVCDISELIFERKPKACLHGHQHIAVDYQLYDTRILSNPHGYPDEDFRFDPVEYANRVFII